MPNLIKCTGWNSGRGLCSLFALAVIAQLALLPANTPITASPQKSTAMNESSLSTGTPESAGMSESALVNIDRAVRSAIEKREIPGAAVLVARNGKIVYDRAFGNRNLEPRPEPMTLDTVFDLASLTKVVATATSMMILVERGKLSLVDPVAMYIPEFGRFGKEHITIEQLLTHRAGLPPDNDIADYVGVTADPLKSIYDLKPIYEPGSNFVYSDVGYIVAAEVVHRVSGKTLDEFAEANIFRPLGMKDTMFLPIKKTLDQQSYLLNQISPVREAKVIDVPGADSPLSRYVARIAATANREGHWMRGEVHDPRAFELGGVAGHAGLFSTADDLAAFCQMILNEGRYHGARVLSPYSIKRMITSIGLPGFEMRGIGWDINTGFSSNRGDLFPVGTFGHTGFTGTSIWLDPWSKTFLVLLTNRINPDGKGSDIHLRSIVASIVAGAIVEPPYAPVFAGEQPALTSTPRAPINRTLPESTLHSVLTGIDVLERDGFKELGGRRIGLVTNQTGIDSNGRSTISVLNSAPNLKVVALFSPEHGISGQADDLVSDQKDLSTGLPIYSLYSQGKHIPKKEQLAGIDTIVYDIQDVGTRFYTYVATCGYLLEAAAQYKLKIVVLDRPDPIGGYEIEGPLPDEEHLNNPKSAFVCYHALPVRYGMSIGELANLLNTERKIGADLDVIKMEGWRRADFYDGTGLTWVNPSPNMRSLTEAILYPGVGLLETTNISVGRGTDTPFEIIGAPWIDGRKLASVLNNSGQPGIRFVPIKFTPNTSKYAGQECGGVNLIVTDRTTFHPVTTGIHIACTLASLYSKEWKTEDSLTLIANRAVVEAIHSGKSARQIQGLWQNDLAAFAKIRSKYLLY